MNNPSRESRINAAFVSVADTLTQEFDVLDLLATLVEQCTSILDADAGGLMLADAEGELQVMTSTSEDADLVEIMQLAADSGPCIECFISGSAVSVADIDEDGVEQRWPEFHRAAVQGGYHAAHATPLKLRGEVIGTMNLFMLKPGALTERDIALAQALSDVATIGILQERVARESTMLAEQLHRALDSRVIVEQAKGMIAYSLGVEIGEAFEILRAYARNNNLNLRDVAEAVSTRTLTVAALAGRPLPLRRPNSR